jgi:hypothetical protein
MPDKVPSKIKVVSVYLYSAEVIRLANLNIKQET